MFYFALIIRKICRRVECDEHRGVNGNEAGGDDRNGVGGGAAGRAVELRGDGGMLSVLHHLLDIALRQYRNRCLAPKIDINGHGSAWLLEFEKMTHSIMKPGRPR